MPLKVLIFSKDRAMQLDAALCSFFLHCSDAHLAQVNVLYLATTSRARRQYTDLQGDFPTVSFVPQKNFHRDTLNLLSSLPSGTWQDIFSQALVWPASLRLRRHSLPERFRRRFYNPIIFPLLRWLTPVPAQDDYVLFCVDDNLFIREFSLARIISALQESPQALGFSLRLGINASFSYALNTAQALPDFHPLEGQVLEFNWVGAEHDFNYPLEVSSSVYRAAQIIPLLNELIFENPNLLESEMAAQSWRFREDLPRLLCFKTSVAFCNPINLVQNVFLENRSGLEYHYPVELLSDMFDQGERIDVKAFTGFVPVSCHQEVGLIFRKAPKP